MGEWGKYIYGIVSEGQGVGVPNGPYATVPLKEAHFIPYQDIAAAVSDAEIVDYTHMFRDALARALVEHQRIIESIMDLGYNVIPMKLGTHAQDEAEVKHILHKGYSLAREIFQKIKDKIELDVVSTYSDFTLAIREAGEADAVKEHKERLSSNPQGITVDDQLKIGFMVKEALGKIRQDYASKIRGALSALCGDIREHELMDDKMVANLACLIQRARQKEFYERIEALNQEFSEKLNFRCVGPLPPYSFFTLEVKKVNSEDVEWARKKLGILNESLTPDEIKHVYKRQAFILHPDRNPSGPGMEKEFEEAREAYNILEDYCSAAEQGARGEGLSCEGEEFKKDTLLVRLKQR